MADDRPDIDTILLDVAATIARRGTCSRLRVGAVVAYQSRILTTGYNGAPAGMEHCRHVLDTNSPCVDAVHAEANALAFAARHGARLDGGTMYCTHSPCRNCAYLIINAGIVKVVYSVLFRDPDPVHVLERAGVETAGPLP